MAILLVPAHIPAPDLWFVAHGDSITLGVGTTDYLTTDLKRYSSLVAQTQTSAGHILGDINFGIDGQGLNYVFPQFPSNTFGTLTADAVTRVDPLLAQPGDHRMVIFAGTNDIFLNSTSGSATGTLLQTYVAARISAGWTPSKVCVVTMLPRQNSHETDRTAYNSSIRSNAAGVGYVVADAAADTTIGQAGDENNATYYVNQIHPTDAGHAILAPIINAALFP